MRRMTMMLSIVLALGVGLRAQTTSAVDAGAPPEATRGPIRVSGGVVTGNLLTRVNPVYPAEARAKGISGTVILHALIGKDGQVESLTAISGPEELQGAALDAVKQWVYKPYLLNGEPTEVDTTVTINFNLTPPAGPVKVSSGVMQSQRVSSVPPVYPMDAKMIHLQGSVVMRALIGKDGKVEQLEAVSGPQILREAAMESVKQWRYKPFLLNGAPTEVETTVVVNFSLNM